MKWNEFHVIIFVFFHIIVRSDIIIDLVSETFEDVTDNRHKGI